MDESTVAALQRVEETVMTIKELEDEVSRLQMDLQRARAELQNAKEDQAGIHCGDIVTQNGYEFLVCRVHPHSFATWLYGHPKKKNGEWSSKKRYLGGLWTKVEKNT